MWCFYSLRLEDAVQTSPRKFITRIHLIGEPLKLPWVLHGYCLNKLPGPSPLLKGEVGVISIIDVNFSSGLRYRWKRGMTGWTFPYCSFRFWIWLCLRWNLAYGVWRDGAIYCGWEAVLVSYYLRTDEIGNNQNSGTIPYFLLWLKEVECWEERSPGEIGP